MTPRAIIVVELEQAPWIVYLADTIGQELDLAETPEIADALRRGIRVAGTVEVQDGHYRGYRLRELYRCQHHVDWFRWAVRQGREIPASIGEDVISACRAYLTAIEEAAT